MGVFIIRLVNSFNVWSINYNEWLINLDYAGYHIGKWEWLESSICTRQSVVFPIHNILTHTYNYCIPTEHIIESVRHANTSKFQSGFVIKWNRKKKYTHTCIVLRKEGVMQYF